MPNSRHFPGSWGKRIYRQGGRDVPTTVLEPWVDVRADIDAINHGKGYVDTHGKAIWVNGRIYGYHSNRPGESPAIPKDGIGTVQMYDKHARALEHIMKYDGLNENTERYIAMSPQLTDADREVIRRLWDMRAEARGQSE